jgi:hypothetical protein
VVVTSSVAVISPVAVITNSIKVPNPMALPIRNRVSIVPITIRMPSTA